MAIDRELTRSPLGLVRTLVVRTVKDSLDDRVPGLAAEVAFYVVLSLPPLLLVILGSLGFVTDWLGPAVAADIRSTILDGATTLLSESTVDELVEPAVDGLLEQGRLDILTVGAIVAVWSASRATRVIIEAVTIAYDRVISRNWWRRQLVALGLTASGIVSVIVLLPLLVIGPQAGAGLADRFGLGSAFETAWAISYWPVVAIVGVVVLTWVYHLVEPETPWWWELPGAFLALSAWALGSYVLRLYATQFIEAESAYRLFAAPLVVLLWVYVAAVAVLVGAELNAELDKIFLQHPEQTDSFAT